MQLFQRLKKTLSSGIDALLEDIENHEAVVVATIEEVERHAVTVRAHRTRCEARIDVLETRELALDGEQRSWRARARSLQGEREKALACVRRLRAAKQAREDALLELGKQHELLEAVCTDERAIAERLDELKRRSAQLRSRQARTEVEGAVPERAAAADALLRWEARVAKSEALWRAGREPGTDAHAENEEAALVSADLDRLLAEEEER